MNTAEIHALADEDLDAAIARAEGWTEIRFSVRPDRIGALTGIDPACPELGGEMYIPRCTQSLDICHAAEERLKEKYGWNGESKWVAALRTIVHETCHVPDYNFAHASARERAEAILRTVQKGTP